MYFSDTLSLEYKSRLILKCEANRETEKIHLSYFL
jgi:hypothetical protein